jgi:hypothetical protein
MSIHSGLGPFCASAAWKDALNSFEHYIQHDTRYYGLKGRCCLAERATIAKVLVCTRGVPGRHRVDVDMWRNESPVMPFMGDAGGLVQKIVFNPAPVNAGNICFERKMRRVRWHMTMQYRQTWVRRSGARLLRWTRIMVTGIG